MSRTKGKLSLLERLLNKVIVNKITDCWEWFGAKQNIGYGLIRVDEKMRSVHRVSYELHIGKIPINMCVCHTCDNTTCINPKHLWLGTRKQNTQDMMTKGRAKPFGALYGLGGMTGKKMPTTLCIHCNTIKPNNMYGKYHGVKCKQKNVSINTI